MSELEEKYQEMLTQKKAAAKKGNEVHDTENNAKDQVERENAAAAAETESSLVEAVAQEIESRSMKRNSTVANKRGVPAQLEHGRQDGWTSTLRGSDEEMKGSERVTTAGERLKNQRPNSLVKIEDEEDAHEVVTGSGCSGGCDLLGSDCRNNAHTVMSILSTIQKNILVHKFRIRMKKAGSIVFHSSSNASEFKNDNKEAHVTTSAAAKESEEFLDKDAQILGLLEERRSTPKEEKQRLKDVSKRIKNCIREKKE